ncbi:exocyst complex component EXO70A1-like, partial [Coffea eugenioides]|uniref:exocyst complex component EXO70A1-like n=1 Tax=Coffea eugenioides TaxID=49369 RepID=UPI000F60930B
ELASLTQLAKDALKAVEESVKREFAVAESVKSQLNASSQSPTRGVAEQPSDACQNRAKIVITIQDKDGPKQFRVFVDDKFERLFKMESLTELVARPQGSNDDRDPPEVPGSQEMDKGLIPLKSHLARVIEFLLYNLKFKPNFYGQESLRCVFMMNNVSSVSEMIKSSKELEELIGTHLQMKLREKVELAKTDYFHRSWGDMCTFLKGEGLKLHFNCDFFPGRSTRVVKKKFKTFNSMFEDILQTQERWIVPDQQLRMKLLECILAKLIPAYNHFLERLSRVHKVKRVSEYIKYSVKDLETKVLDMFQNKY